MDGKQISISPASIPDMPLGENILIKLSDGKPSHASNTKALFFYPNIPQPILTGTQTIGENEAALRKLTLSFDRQLRTDLDEKLRLITIYDTVATGTGNNPVSEARVLFQQAVDITRLPTNLKYTLDIPLIYHIDEGTYYVSVEGTARDKSNHPEAGNNKVLSAENVGGQSAPEAAKGPCSRSSQTFRSEGRFFNGLLQKRNSSSPKTTIFLRFLPAGELSP